MVKIKWVTLVTTLNKWKKMATFVFKSLSDFRLLLRRWSSTDLKAVIAEKIPPHLEKIKKFRKEHGKDKVGEILVDQVYGGMRGMQSLICETSYLDPEEGIRFRGLTIPECREKLPKYTDEPLPEGIFWLLCTGDVPNDEQVECLSQELAKRAELPPHVCKFLNTISPTVHPMSQLSAACTIMNTESEFVKAYSKGVKKTQLWESTYDDAINLMAKATPIAALIYKNTFKNRADIGVVDTSKDWSCNFCHMLGFDDINFVELMRLYLTIHSDHESGNVSAHTCHLVGSALSDPYLSFAASMNGLAGPLHGLANQEVLTFLEGIQKELGDNPSEDQLKDFIQKWLKKGVVPGYGHAVLRKTDPRFAVQREFAEKHLPEDPLFRIVSGLYKVVPPILQALGKVQNPWPNVDAHSGVLLSYYGLKEKQYYTVLFGVSRLMGVMANLIWDRAMLLPLERPKSITSDMLMERIAGDNKKGRKKIKCK